MNQNLKAGSLGLERELLSTPLPTSEDKAPVRHAQIESPKVGKYKAYSKYTFIFYGWPF